MKTFRRFQQALPLWLTLFAFGTLSADTQKPGTDQAELNSIATNAFLALKAVPAIGLEQSAGALEQIIATHHRLSRAPDSTQRHLSLVLADAVAYAIVSEIHRSELARLGLDQVATQKGIPFDKKTAVRLWRTNASDFVFLIRKALQGKDTVTSYVAEHSSEEEVLDGRMIDKAPVGAISTRIQELGERALSPFAVRKDPSPDEQLMLALTTLQAHRDLTVIVDLYEKGDLPSESGLFRSTVEGVLKRYPERRVDDGMEASSIMVMSSFHRYRLKTDQHSPEYDDLYRFRQAIVLAPFMTDTSMLPELAQKALMKMRQPTVSPPQ